MPYLKFYVNTDLEIEDLGQMSEKFETALSDSDSRFLEVELVQIQHFDDTSEKEARNG